MIDDGTQSAPGARIQSASADPFLQWVHFHPPSHPESCQVNFLAAPLLKTDPTSQTTICRIYGVSWQNLQHTVPPEELAVWNMATKGLPCAHPWRAAHQLRAAANAAYNAQTPKRKLESVMTMHRYWLLSKAGSTAEEAALEHN